MTPYQNVPYMGLYGTNMNLPETTAPGTNLPMQQMPAMEAMMPNMQPMCPLQNMMMQPVCPLQNMMPMQTAAPIMPAQHMNPMMQMNMGMPMMNMTEDMDIAGTSPAASDPPPVLSNNPAVTQLTLFKELTGYPNYGNPSGNADILYTGNRGVWTFDIPAFLFVPGNQRAQLIIRAVLDDHTNVPVRQYSARITVNGNVVHTGALPLEHGTPVGGRFNNWRSLTFNVTNFRRNNRIVIENTSTAGLNDWIAFDWMEMRIVPR